MTRFSREISSTPVIYPPYKSPHGLPWHWQHEASGVLAAAVTAYLDSRIEKKPISEEQLATVRAYIKHYINAPCWDGDGTFSQELATLRNWNLSTSDDIGAFIAACMDIGLDPL